MLFYKGLSGTKQRCPNPHISSTNSVSPAEFMILEEVWNIAKRDLLVLKYYPSFEDFKKNISRYFRTKRFNMNMRNYLLREV